MTIDSAQIDYHPEADKNVEFLLTTKFSSIEMISRSIGKTPDQTIAFLLELLEAGIIHGRFSDDESRFFRSNVEISKAPVVAGSEELVIEKHDTSLGKNTSIAGIIAIIVGEVVSHLGGVFGDLTTIGASIVILGMALFVGGLIYINQKDTSVVD